MTTGCRVTFPALPCQYIHVFAETGIFSSVNTFCCQEEMTLKPFHIFLCQQEKTIKKPCVTSSDCLFFFLAVLWRPPLTLVHRQGPEFNGYLVGRGNSRDIDLNRNFPDLNGLMYYYEKTNGRNHHLPLPDNWEQQVSQCCWETQDLTSPIRVFLLVGVKGGKEDGWAHFLHWCECVLTVWMWARIASHCKVAESSWTRFASMDSGLSLPAARSACAV